MLLKSMGIGNKNGAILSNKTRRRGEMGQFLAGGVWVFGCFGPVNREKREKERTTQNHRGVLDLREYPEEFDRICLFIWQRHKGSGKTRGKSGTAHALADSLGAAPIFPGARIKGRISSAELERSAKE